MHSISQNPDSKRKVRCAIFASGNGSNAEAIIYRSWRVDSAFSVNLIVSNNSRCGAIDLATAFFIPSAHISSATHPDENDRTRAMQEILRDSGIEIIALAGYMKHLPSSIAQTFSGRILNVHPALLPKFGGHGMFGINVHKAVIEAKEATSGATIHFVNDEYDTGEIYRQESVTVLTEDTPESLAAKVQKIEHDIFPQAIQDLSLSLLSA